MKELVVHAIAHRAQRGIVIVAGLMAIAAGPAASLARAEENSGPVDPNETRATKEQCKMYHDWYTQDLADGKKQDAAYDRGLAGRRGCNWAQGRYVTVGPIIGPPVTTLPGQPVDPFAVSGSTSIVAPQG